MSRADSAQRAFEEIAFQRDRQAIWDRDQHGPFPWMLKSPEAVLREQARATLLEAGFSQAAVDEVIRDCEEYW